MLICANFALVLNELTRLHLAVRHGERTRRRASSTATLRPGWRLPACPYPAWGGSRRGAEFGLQCGPSALQVVAAHGFLLWQILKGFLGSADFYLLSFHAVY